MPLPTVDVVVACGALNYRSADPDFPLEMIRRMYEAARDALVFNVLDAAHFPDHPLLVGRDRGRILSFCRELSPDVAVVETHLVDDLTVRLRRA